MAQMSDRGDLADSIVPSGLRWASAQPRSILPSGGVVGGCSPCLCLPVAAGVLSVPGGEGVSGKRGGVLGLRGGRLGVPSSRW